MEEEKKEKYDYQKSNFQPVKVYKGLKGKIEERLKIASKVVKNADKKEAVKTNAGKFRTGMQKFGETLLKISDTATKINNGETGFQKQLAKSNIGTFGNSDFDLMTGKTIKKKNKEG
jgi:3-methyladenine DNA glycosylase Tag